MDVQPGEYRLIFGGVVLGAASMPQNSSSINIATRPNGGMTDLTERIDTSIMQLVLAGFPHDAIVHHLGKRGVDPCAALEVAIKLENRLGDVANFQAMAQQKIHWMASVTRQLRHSSGKPLVEECSKRIEPEVFFERYYFCNRPVVLRNVLNGWEPFIDISFTSLLREFSNCLVEVLDNCDSGTDHETDPDKYRRSVLFSVFVERIMADATDSVYLVAHNHNLDGALAPLRRRLRNLSGITSVESDGGVSLWMGPAGSITNLHYDSVNSLHLQVQGSKRFTLIPPDNSVFVYPYHTFYSRINLRSIDTAAFPLFEFADRAEVVLEPGDALFIPVGWWHHVVGLAPTLCFGFTKFVKPNTYP
ncbi:MAG TPA: cupin-like domain-containing protein [Candidatus Cybelea sp.]|jgi:hypothetical protein|nr:cupin-like domain-containing protein [Candidatus Cybelea sp.]